VLRRVAARRRAGKPRAETLGFVFLSLAHHYQQRGPHASPRKGSCRQFFPRIREWLKPFGLPRSVSADRNQTTARLEHAECVQNVLYVGAILERRIHNHAIECAEIPVTLQKVTAANIRKRVLAPQALGQLRDYLYGRDAPPFRVVAEHPTTERPQ